MEIEFDVKMTSGDLYDYMLHHTYGSMSGLIGAVAGALMVVAGFSGAGVLCIIAGIVILLYLPVTLFLKSKQQFLANPAFKQPLHYKLTEEGIEVSQGEEVQSQKWEDMYKAVSTTKSLVIYTTAVNAAIFPRRDLGEHLPAVIEIISKHMPPKKVKIRF
ncbi:MAG: YcxB family protein [Lachnospiraceae bacterium]|nr:YcxB family protein [Lachnospiraceae bacterium]